MFYTPDPIPISIIPLLIFDAIIAHDYNPDEHNLFTTITDVVSGNPAKNWAILEGIYPAPGWRLFPTAISSTNFGFNFALSHAALKANDNKYSGAVSFKSPFFAFVNGVRTAEQITTSSALLLLAIFYEQRTVSKFWSLFIKSYFFYDNLYINLFKQSNLFIE